MLQGRARHRPGPFSVVNRVERKKNRNLPEFFMRARTAAFPPARLAFNLSAIPLPWGEVAIGACFLALLLMA